MITASFDRPKLEKSLKKYAKQFGDTTAQAVIRWGVQTCREMAFETQVWGKAKTGKNAKPMPFPWVKGVQERAIVIGALNVVTIVLTVGPRNKQGVRTAQELNDWIEFNRTRRRGRTATLPIEQRKKCTIEVFKAAMKMRFAHAGMAKGGWLAAGKKMAVLQTGGEKIAIGKNYMGWAQKAGKDRGSVTPPKSSFRPSALITNAVAHTASRHVLDPKRAANAINFGLKKTVKWYSTALNKANKDNMRPR